MTKIFSQIHVISANVWRQALRDRVLMGLVGSGWAILVFSLILGKMAVGGEDRVLRTMGFWTLGIWGLLSVVYLGSGIMRDEFKNRTVYVVLSRPISRHVFLLGKFLGMALVLSAVYALLLIFWLALVKAKGVDLNVQYFWALVFIFGEWLLLAAFSLFFAAFTTPLLHNFFLIGIYFLGHWAVELRTFAANTHHFGLKICLTFLYYVLPNLEAVNFRSQAIYGSPIDAHTLFYAGACLFAWGLAVVFSAMMIFRWAKRVL